MTPTTSLTFALPSVTMGGHPLPEANSGRSHQIILLAVTTDTKGEASARSLSHYLADASGWYGLRQSQPRAFYTEPEIPTMFWHCTRLTLPTLILLMSGTACLADVQVVDTPATATRNSHYVEQPRAAGAQPAGETAHRQHRSAGMAAPSTGAGERGHGRPPGRNLALAEFREKLLGRQARPRPLWLGGTALLAQGLRRSGLRAQRRGGHRARPASGSARPWTRSATTAGSAPASRSPAWAASPISGRTC